MNQVILRPFSPASCPNEKKIILKLEQLNHQVTIAFIREISLDTRREVEHQIIFNFSDCWVSGLEFRILEFLKCLKYLKNRCNFTIRWLLDLGNTSLEQTLRLKTLGYLLFIPAIFFFFYVLSGCPMANFWLLLSKQSYSPNVNHCIGYQFLAQNWTERSWVSKPNRVPSELWSQCHNTPNWKKYSAQR